MANRVTMFERSGKVISSRHLIAKGPSAALSGAAFVGVLRDGSIVLSMAGVGAGGSSVAQDRSRAPIYRVDTLGNVSLLTQVPDLDVVSIKSEYRDGPTTRRVPARFTRNAFATVLDSFTVVADGGIAGFDVIAPSQSLVAKVRVAGQRRAVTPAMVRAAVDSELVLYDAPMREAARDVEAAKREVRSRPHTDSLPAVQSLFAFPGSIVWMVDTKAPSDSAWSAVAFDVEGNARGRLLVPGYPAPLMMWDDFVAFIVPDRDGVDQLFIYRILGLDVDT